MEAELGGLSLAIRASRSIIFIISALFIPLNYTQFQDWFSDPPNGYKGLSLNTHPHCKKFEPLTVAAPRNIEIFNAIRHKVCELQGQP